MGGNLQCIRTHEVLPSTAVTTSKMTACVKVFGCRPLTIGGARRAGPAFENLQGTKPRDRMSGRAADSAYGDLRGVRDGMRSVLRGGRASFAAADRRGRAVEDDRWVACDIMDA